MRAIRPADTDATSRADASRDTRVRKNPTHPKRPPASSDVGDGDDDDARGTPDVVSCKARGAPSAIITRES